MRNRKMCKNCMYYGNFSNSITYCNYSATEKTCLTKVNGKVVDRRGKDMNDCKLFKSRWNKGGQYEESDNDLR